MPRWTALTLVLVVASGLAPTARTQTSDAKARSLYEQTVGPVLEGTCVRCHGEGKASNSLRLDSREAILKGGDSGPAVELDDPEESLLIQAIRHEGGLEMPPKKPKLPEATIAAFVEWARLGAPVPR